VGVQIWINEGHYFEEGVSRMRLRELVSEEWDPYWGAVLFYDQFELKIWLRRWTPDPESTFENPKTGWCYIYWWSPK
jgi:hypothetical protein